MILPAEQRKPGYGRRSMAGQGRLQVGENLVAVAGTEEVGPEPRSRGDGWEYKGGQGSSAVRTIPATQGRALRYSATADILDAGQFLL
jgi:hypothetical protein